MSLTILRDGGVIDARGIIFVARGNQETNSAWSLGESSNNQTKACTLL